MSAAASSASNPVVSDIFTSIPWSVARPPGGVGMGRAVDIIELPSVGIAPVDAFSPAPLDDLEDFDELDELVDLSPLDDGISDDVLSNECVDDSETEATEASATRLFKPGAHSSWTRKR